MKKNLSILIYSLASGGAERVVSILLNELKENYNITLILMNKTIFYNIPTGVCIEYLENSLVDESGMKKFFKLPFLGWKYKNICKKKSISVSLSFMNRPNYINIFSKIIGNKSKIIISERAMPSLQHQNGLQGFINRFLIKLLYSKSDIATANSLGNSLDLIDNFHIDKITTINNPFDIKEIEKLSNDDIKLLSNDFKFISVGRLDSGKNHKLMINAIKNIAAKLYIIGDGELRGELETQIEELKLDKKVFLLGKQINPYKYLAKADCFVFSSNHEGFPNVLLEALACGLPIISTDCKSGPREILSPKSDMKSHLIDKIELSEYGILTPVNDKIYLVEAMKLMQADKRLRDNYIQKAKSRASNFNKDTIIKGWIKVIEN